MNVDDHVLICGEECIEDKISEQQTNQETDEEEEMVEHEEAITQKATCNEAIEHLNALQCFVESISEMPQQIWKTICGMENYILQHLFYWRLFQRFNRRPKSHHQSIFSP
jgi:hypothetical protein